MSEQKIPLGLTKHEHEVMIERQLVIERVAPMVGKIAVEPNDLLNMPIYPDPPRYPKPNSALIAGTVKPNQFRPY